MPEDETETRTPETPLFTSVAQPHAAAPPGRKRLFSLVLVAVGLHAAMLFGVATLWRGVPRRMEGEATHGEVLVLRLTTPRARSAPATTTPPSSDTSAAVATPDTTTAPKQPSRLRAARRPRPFRAPTPPRVPPEPRPQAPPLTRHEPVPAPNMPASGPGAPTLAEPLSAAPPAGPASDIEGSLAGRSVAGAVQRSLGPGVPGLLVEAPPEVSPDDTADADRRAFEQMFRDRFEDLPYPHQARMAGLEGQFVLRISVGVQGQLVDLGVVGACPHSILCDAALDAVRKAAPFPPPPPALGGRVTVELPFNFHLE
ncbi:Ferric siderophore transport system, periplasmic binding protein TonB [Myxococcus hansupus]|uniref:Ferric siderophore transport system, periplasmic binding protein TonB n=1 Tax=Pseudomyxococcus hansupus TaxID=1297742 RepID=A0A0H4X7H0_9BACT|nr:TonB family protein [Myxococcus hansupus]AKQ69530.1 Ferric siderophore transport system, periplasmic binding protein TonB [Myxococcus hansupus]